MPRCGPAEIAVSAAWHAGAIPARLVTVDGESIEVVHRGAWTHGLGPDFRDALVLFAGRELRAGGIEIHLRTRGWSEHGHHRDPAYNTVILHLVLRHDGAETRRLDGALVPVAVIDPPDTAQLPDLAAWDWDRVGGVSCAEDLARDQPRQILGLLFDLGDRRLAARSARIEARLSSAPPAEVLWHEILDGLGFSANRAAMQALAHLVRLADLEALLLVTPRSERLSVARAALLGAAGFLPLAPTDAHLGRLDPDEVSALERAWSIHGGPWREGMLLPGAWDRRRVRPANHPVPRLLAAASLVVAASGHGGLLPAVLETLVGHGDPVASLRVMTTSRAAAGIGEDRALDILASGVIPFALALSSANGDDTLAAAASRHWEVLPAPAPNAVTRRALRQVAGSARIANSGARGAQGLIQLDTAYCQPRRCFECPIAAAVLAPCDEKGPNATT